MEVLGDYADFPQPIDPINLLFFKMSGYENILFSICKLFGSIQTAKIFCDSLADAKHCLTQR